MDNDQQIKILYEISLSIGNSLKSNELFKEFLTQMLHKLNLVGAAIFCYGQTKPEYIIPRRAIGLKMIKVVSLFFAQHKTFNAHLLYFNLPSDTLATADPLYDKEINNYYLYILHLPGYGVLLLLRKEPLAMLFVNRLEDICHKLVTSIRSCETSELLLEREKLVYDNYKITLEKEAEIIKNKEKDKYLFQQSKQAQMGEMISMIAHQWRQPLSAIASVSSAIHLKATLNKLDRGSAIDLSDKISAYIQHLSTTIEDFRNFFKPTKKKKKANFDEIINDVLSIISLSIENKNISIIKNLNCQESLYTFANEIKQVILNLIKNAEDCLLDNTISEPEIQLFSYKKNDSLILEVSDNGGGIPESIIDKIFEPYFSTKIEKNGTGLGLYMSKIIIEEHCGGKLSASNTKNGAVFKVELKTSKLTLKKKEDDFVEIQQSAIIDNKQKRSQDFVELSNISDVIILCIASIAETLDSKTGYHAQRTQHYIRILAKSLQHHPSFNHYLTNKNIQFLFKVAALHDIGNISVSNKVLLKQGKLNDEEFKEMQAHPKMGYEAFVRAEQQLGHTHNPFLKMVEDIILTHHEKWDGSGYPNGLKANEIPICGRLMAIADVYDALTRKRSYRDAYSHTEAVNIILLAKNKHFDPDVVDAFMQVEKEFQHVAMTFSD